MSAVKIRRVPPTLIRFLIRRYLTDKGFNFDASHYDESLRKLVMEVVPGKEHKVGWKTTRLVTVKASFEHCLGVAMDAMKYQQLLDRATRKLQETP